MTSKAHTKLAIKPRKFPQQRRSEATVDDVVEAAARILERDGLEGYNTNAIARLAGISIGSLYQYFPNKESITRALILREASATLEIVERMPSQISADEAIDYIITVAIKRQLARPTLARLIDIEEDRLDVLDDIMPCQSQVEALITALLAVDNKPQSTTLGVDIVSIIKGMVDRAGARGESDVSDLTARVRRAVFGYIDG